MPPMKSILRPTVLALAGAALATWGLAYANSPGDVATPVTQAADPAGLRDSLAAPGTFTVAATAPDPRGGPDYGVGLYRNATGARCVVFGRHVAGAIGGVDGEGTFRSLPLEHGGTCLPEFSAEMPVGVNYARSHGTGMTVWGVASPAVTSVGIEAGAARHEIRPNRHGVFLLPLDGVLARGRIVVRMTGGATKVLRIPDFGALRDEMRRSLAKKRAAQEHRVP